MARGSFRLGLQSFQKKFGAKTDTLVRAVALDVLGTVVQRTPVDTGRARGNWQLTIGSPAGGTLPRIDKQGAQAIAAAAAPLAGFKAGPSIWIVNNLPYIQGLEYGRSDQAPSGMVRITAREWGAKVARIAQGMAR